MAEIDVQTLVRGGGPGPGKRLSRPRGSTGRIEVCPWWRGKRWVYSISFDEALSELHRYTIPILDELNCPGHLEVVAGQLGQVRQIGNSTYNGMKHMDGSELREMLARGWGVGNHSWSHLHVNAETAEQELLHARQIIEDTIGQPVTIYCAPGSNCNMNDEALDACREYGYLGAMSITDALNRPDDRDLLWLNRTFLHTQGYEPFYSEFDPFRNILHAKRDQGWIIDYLHCPLDKALHANKDCSAAELRERVETVCEQGGSSVWLANVDDAADYRYMRRHVQVSEVDHGRYLLATPGLPEQVRRRVLTLHLTSSPRAVHVDGAPVNPYTVDGQTLIDVELDKPTNVNLIG